MSDLVDRSPWTERYRPKTLSEISGQNEVVAVLSNTIQTQNLPHLLLYGPPGTGKTSIILALARQLYGANGLKGRLLELNASDERGIDVIREKVKNFAKITVSAAHSNAPPYKIIVLDEADSLTTDAQSALRRIMENYSKITRFCLICNYVSRIIDPLASRCAKLRFKPIPMPIVIERLELICSNEKLSFAPGYCSLQFGDVSFYANVAALDFLATSCAGDLRKAITLLQSIKKVSIGSTVTKSLVADISGIIPDSVMAGIIQAWSSGKVENVEAELKQTIRMGYSGTAFIQQLSNLIAEDPHLKERHKSKVAVLLGQTDRALVDGADEHLQILKVLLMTMVH
ncbi:hypothetical protein BDEG_21846 [Batrachochytrium dendrobatidis JEL423]|uniref:AAA+ ATPase domain-containing protein n=1 Tax=Batrachochytrium dendrobatidis (strain JEL423) TaxID=403673 RepID=A0A177WDX1_BATDL|nr:hypothetical protein BDEG_21846 [Batrachochytrium dendrobatidis JEL423]